MDKLKQILKKALETGASHIILREGEAISAVLEHGKKDELKDLGVADAALIDGLYKALFPKEGLAIMSQQVVKSQFNIVNVGKVHAIAEPKPPKALHLFFPPRGELLSEDFWVKLVSPKDYDQTKIKATASEGLSPSGGSGVGTQVVYESIVIPEEVLEHKHHLCLIASKNSELIQIVKTLMQKRQLHTFATENPELFSTLISSFRIPFLFLDEKSTAFKTLHRLVYDQDAESRVLSTIFLFSETYKKSDTKQAFAMSVDGIIHVKEMEYVEGYIQKVHNERKEIFSAWLKTKSISIP